MGASLCRVQVGGMKTRILAIIVVVVGLAGEVARAADGAPAVALVEGQRDYTLDELRVQWKLKYPME